MQEIRTWFTIRFYRENNLTAITQQKMLAIPSYGSYIQFSKEISKDIFQVIDYPKHIIGKSTNNNSYHYISVTIREFILSIEENDPPDTSLEE